MRIAMDAAGQAGQLLASWRGDERPEVIDTKSSPTDVVTEMDRRSEALITEWIRGIRPGILRRAGHRTFRIMKDLAIPERAGAQAARPVSGCAVEPLVLGAW